MLLPHSLRRTLLQPAVPLTLRTLTTTVSSSSLPSNEAPPIFRRQHATTFPDQDQLPTETPRSNLTRKFAISPVFIELSSLLHKSHSSNETDRVAALSPSVFRHPIRRDILHLCVVHHLDGLRQGTAANKSRGEVRGSGRKVRTQKGSGMARLGDGQSPMLRGGGRTFAKKARDFSTKLPRKVIQMGMRVALSVKVKENSLGIVETLEWTGVKTKDFARRIEELGWKKTLFVTGLEHVPDNLNRSSRNVPDVDVVTTSQLTVYDAMKWQRLVLDLSAVEFYEKTLGKEQVDRLAVLG